MSHVNLGLVNIDSHSGKQPMISPGNWKRLCLPICGIMRLSCQRDKEAEMKMIKATKITAFITGILFYLIVKMMEILNITDTKSGTTILFLSFFLLVYFFVIGMNYLNLKDVKFLNYNRKEMTSDDLKKMLSAGFRMLLYFSGVVISVIFEVLIKTL